MKTLFRIALGTFYHQKKQGHNVFSALCDTFDDARLAPLEEKINTCENRLSRYKNI